MKLKPTDKILLIIERNKELEETYAIFHDMLCRQMNAVDIWLVDKVINPMFCEIIGNGVPLVGHMFVANGIAKEDLPKCFYHKELTKEELNKLGL